MLQEEKGILPYSSLLVLLKGRKFNLISEQAFKVIDWECYSHGWDGEQRGAFIRSPWISNDRGPDVGISLKSWKGENQLRKVSGMGQTRSSGNREETKLTTG